MTNFSILFAVLLVACNGQKTKLAKAEYENFIGNYKCEATDLNFEPEGYVARQSYSGTGVISTIKGDLILEITFGSPDSEISQVKGVQFVLRSELDVRGDYLAGSYSIDHEVVKGFGSIMLKLKEDGNIKGHTVFSSSVSDIDFGMTTISLIKT